MRGPSLVSAGLAILFRLPPGFLLPFLVLVLGWTFLMFQEVKRFVLNFRTGPFEGIVLMSRLDDIVVALLILAVYFAGLLLAYNLAVLIEWLWTRYGPTPAPIAAVVPHRPAQISGGEGAAGQSTDAARWFDGIGKIGIVLAGGGAKGAFQAGTMKAIYRFLAEHNALDKVKVISATSIGSWNAMFWLADLITAEAGWETRAPHEGWWRAISLRALITPSWYVPCLRNAFFGTGPWQRQFMAIFGQDTVRPRLFGTDIHFYLTSSHVVSGLLECTTNNLTARDLPRVKFDRIDRADPNFLTRLRDGVFASMDLPPLFPYVERKDECFEDGGVIDNLPVMFPAMESCDLIFVLPLNSDFNAKPNYRSLLNRFLRVMDVRQGALERGNIKTFYLYNELAVLRKYAHTLEKKLATAGMTTNDAPMSETLKRALERGHQEARLFAICPQRTFVETTIDTPELWKAREAGRAFSTMYKHSLFALENYFDPEHEHLQVLLIDEGGQVRVDVDF